MRVSPTASSLGTGGGSHAEVAAGAVHSCELRADRSVWCIGDNQWGQLGTGDLEPVTGAIQVGAATDWISITGGEVHTCGLRPGDELWCWGAYPHHEQDPGGTLVTPTGPVEVDGDHAWRSVAPGTTHTCGILVDHTLRCWGLNLWGEVGDGTTSVAGAPQAVAGGPWRTVATGLTSTCAIGADGTLWCWGANSHPDPDPSPIVPTRLGSDDTWVSIAGRGTHYCATRTDGTLWCWGANHDGQLGQGTATTSSISLPTQVGTDTDWRSVGTGPAHTCANRLDWSLWCWGRNNEGQVGDGGSVDALSPVLVDDSRRWIGFELGYEFTVAFSLA
ncbi:MAG: hypothetical protein R2707_06340 [Acidimicrobiales bacterium]